MGPRLVLRTVPGLAYTVDGAPWRLGMAFMFDTCAPLVIVFLQVCPCAEPGCASFGYVVAGESGAWAYNSGRLERVEVK